MTDDIHPATCVRALARAMRVLSGEDPDHDPAADLRGLDLHGADLRGAAGVPEDASERGAIVD